MENKAEIWKAHPEYAGIEVSTLGNVRTLDKIVRNGWGTRLRKGRVLKQHENRNGYMRVGITIDGKRVNKYVHRLVAQTFISNPNNLPQINHRDCVRDDNRVSNLEFCTRSYNNQYREKFGESRVKPVFAINLSTLEVSRFRSQKEAGRELGVFASGISSVIKGTQKKTHGFWFVNDDGHAVDVVKSKLHDIGKTGLKI